MPDPGTMTAHGDPSDPTASLLTQAVFEAAWDLRARAHRGEAVSADPYLSALRAAGFFQPAALRYLLEAEELAAAEVAAAPEGYPELVALLSEGLPQETYPYLTPLTGYLGSFGDYRVVRELGRGGMGVVFEAELTRPRVGLPRRAIKILPPDKATTEAVGRFRREATNQYDLRHHPNVVEVHDADTMSVPGVGDVEYIDMQFVFGLSLEGLIHHFRREGVHVPVPLAAELVRQAASGLSAAHLWKPQIVHRDVKPGNILLEWVIGDDDKPAGWRARVADFGLAMTAEQTRVTADGARPGTFAYTAPELLDGRHPLADCRCDVWSLGAVLFELVCGQHPFLAESVAATCGKILYAPVEPRAANAAIPVQLAELITRMLDRTPEKRPTAAEVGDVLATFSEADTEPAPAADRVDVSVPVIAASEGSEGASLDVSGTLREADAARREPLTFPSGSPPEPVPGAPAGTSVGTRGRWSRSAKRLSLAAGILPAVLTLWNAVGPRETENGRNQHTKAVPTKTPSSGFVIAGTVRHSKTALPLEGAEVILSGVSTRDGMTPVGRTNEHGRYHFADLPPLPPGSLEIGVRAAKAGYRESFVRQAPGYTINIIELDPEP